MSQQIIPGAGEANTASNIGAGGVGVYDQKVGVDLQFRNIIAGSAMIDVTLDAPNNEIEIDVDPAEIDLGDLGDVNPAAPNDGDVLTWDAVGAEWEPVAPGGGGGGAENPMAHRRVGRGYTTWDYYTSTTQQAVRDKLYAYPFIVPVAQSFDRIVVGVSAAQAGGVARVGIYDDDGDVYPDNLIVSSAELDCSVIGYKTTVIAETLDPGLHWLVIISDSTAANITFRAMDYNQSSPLSYFAILGKDPTNFVLTPGTHWSLADAYGALPDPFPGGASLINNENMITIMLRVA